MKTKIYLLIICSLIGFQIEAQDVSILEANNQSMLLEFQLENYSITPMDIVNETIDVVTAKECAYFQVKGEPALPFYAKSIMIPDDSKPEIEITNISYKEIKVNRIIPSRGPLPVGVNADNIHYDFGEAYRLDKWYPEVHTEVGEPYILRDINGIVLYFNPFMYNPVQDILRIAQSITIKVTFKEAMDSGLPKNLCHDFQNIYKNHFINYQFYGGKYTPIIDVGDMIIITTSEFISNAEFLATWKNRKGIPTTCYLYPDETGSTPEEIKNFIQGIYDQTGTLTFILIVGDAEDVPPGVAYAGYPNAYPADPVYTLLAGNDEYPDAFIGRLSVENSEEAVSVINKNLWYEMNPDPSGEWYHKATGIASDDQLPSSPPDTVIAENIRQDMLGYTYTHVDRFYDPGATYTEVLDALEEGRGFVNYIGHGSPTAWTTTGMNNNHVSELTNSNKTPVIISTACAVGSFSNLTCFAEVWLRQGGIHPRGAIAFMGCSTTQYSISGYAHMEMVDLLVAEEYFTLGGMFTNGVMLGIDIYNHLGNGGGPQLFQSWILFGDPSLFMYTDTPSEMIVNYPSNLIIGDTSISVSVYDNSIPLPDALVALYMNDSSFGSCYTDEFGLAEISFGEPMQLTGIMEINATARNKIPVFDTIQVVSGLPCLPEGINFTTQVQIDSFQINYPGCNEIVGDVEINGVDITNLNGLNVITAIYGNLKIGTIGQGTSLTDLTGLSNLSLIGGSVEIIHNDSLISLTGLENITNLYGSLKIGIPYYPTYTQGNPLLTDLAGLDSLVSIGEDLVIWGNNNLINFSGLNALAVISGDISICENDSLISLIGLECLTSIHGNVVIGEFSGSPNGIFPNLSLESLSGLNNLNSIAGSLQIELNPNLQNLQGLNNLDFVGESFTVSSNVALTTLTDLDNLSYIGGGIEISGNGLLTDLTGLENLTSIYGDLRIGEINLTNLTGLNNVSSIDGEIFISHCALANLIGLNNLFTIGGDLNIMNNDYLTDLTGLENVTSYGGDINILSNDILASLSGVADVTSISGGIKICDNDSLTNLTGLESISFIGNYFFIMDNASLYNMAGLDNLDSIGGNVWIGGNDNLFNLEGFDNVTSIQGDISIGGYLYYGNPSLVSLSGLDNISASSIENLEISHNNSLSTCEVQSICDYLVSLNGTAGIHDNAPGCNSQQEVIDACDTGAIVKEVNAQHIFTIAPNPLNSNALISYTLDQSSIVKLSILDLSGRMVVSFVNETQQQGEQRIIFNTKGLKPGIYFCTLKTNKGIQTKKIIKL